MYPYPFLLRGAGQALSTGPLFDDPTAAVILALFVGLAVFVSGFPNVGLLFFGSWGVVVPALLWESSAALGSSFGVAVTAACWLPFGHSLLVLGLLWREGDLF